MKKKLLLVLPLLFGVFATSCSNDPATKPISRNEFVNNLNNVKKQAETTTNTSGVRFSAETKVETDLTINGQTLKLFAENKNEVKANGNKLVASTSVDTHGETLIEGKKQSVNASVKANLWGEYNKTASEVKLMMDLDAKAKTEGQEGSQNAKYYTILPQTLDSEKFYEYVKEVSEDYGSFTAEQIDEAMKSLQETLIADFGYIKEGETEVFTISQKTNAGENNVAELNVKLRFDGYLLTKYEINTTAKVTDPTGQVSYIKASNKVSAEEFKGDIVLPDVAGYQEISFENFEQALDELN